MDSLTAEAPALATGVRVTSRTLEVVLEDGRVLSVPLEWYPRLASGSARERQHWRLIRGGVGIHWPELDEDISVTGLLAGLRSGESLNSFKQWLRSRRRPPSKTQPASRSQRKTKSTRKARAARG